MDVTTLITLLGFLLAVIITIIGGVAWLNSQISNTREEQIQDDKSLEKKLTEYVDRITDSMSTSINSIKDSAATRSEVSLTETRLTAAINELKLDNRNQFARIDSKLDRVPEMVQMMQNLDTLLRGAVGKGN